jgi:hypothetical protein
LKNNNKWGKNQEKLKTLRAAVAKKFPKGTKGVVAKKK